MNDQQFNDAVLGRRPFDDFEWYATDRIGNLASLTTAGLALAPMVALRSKKEFDACSNYFLSLPIRCDAVLAVDLEFDAKSWIEASRRGLYAYDWNHSIGQFIPGAPYRLIASPKVPLTIEELPSDVRRWLQPIKFNSIRFAETFEILPETEFSEFNF